MILNINNNPKNPENQIEKDIEFCPNCEIEMDFFESGKFKDLEWESYRCRDCGYSDSNEPYY